MYWALFHAKIDLQTSYVYIYIYIYMDSKSMILMFKGNLNSNKNYELIWTGLLPLRQERRVFVWIAFEMEKHSGPG